VGNVTNMSNMFEYVTLSTENYNSLLLGWSQQQLQPNVNFHGGNSHYNYGAPADARQSIIDNFNWTITDGGMVPVTATIATTPVTEILEHTALSGGNITSEGGSPVTDRGVIWSTQDNPDLNNYEGITFDGSGFGAFTSELTNLLPETTYYVCAYATNSAGTAYGEVLSFTTLEPSTVDLTLNFGQGYTWFSENLAPENSHPTSVFEGLNACNNDRLIGQNSFSVFYNGSWVGSLTAMNPQASYRMKLCEADVFTLTALPAPIEPMSLSSGYTWIGYLPQECMDVNEALEDMNPQPSYNDRLIGQSSFAVYSGSQWIGSLTALCPGNGYVIKLENGSTLTYPNTSNNSKTVFEQQILSPIGENPATNLQHSMTVVASIELPSGHFSSEAGDRLYAYINGKCVGMASPDQTNTYHYFLSIGENTDELQQVVFKVWLNEEEQLYRANETINFVPLKGLGLPDKPFIITLGEKLDDFDETVIGKPYPNPFEQETILPVKLTEDAEVKVYFANAMGIIAVNPKIFTGVKGNNEFIIKSDNLAPGVYQLIVEVNGSEVSLRKVQMIVHLE
jgi:hypothetical protein